MQLGRIAQLGILNVAVVVLPMLGGGAVHARAAAQPARELQVLVGAGQDTVGIDAYLPRELRVRAGDTVTWHINSDEPHTVAFTHGFTGGAGTIPSPIAA